MLDYDGTYGADVEMWKQIIPIMQASNHNIYLVTSRGMDTPVELAQDFKDFGIPIIYCNYRAKRKVCEERGINISIWVDDDPFRIDKGFIDEYKEQEIIEKSEDSYTVLHLKGGHHDIY